ncbi:MAG: tetratricopeptide repeat protein [Rhodospirillales bacterium]|nr:tetratricopeptide repeat protein [Rhodospirillales bacterium]
MPNESALLPFLPSPAAPLLYRATDVTEPDVDGRYAAALELHRKGKHAAAADAYEQILAVRPDHVDALNNLATIAWNERNLPKALALLGRVIAFAPDDAGHLRSLGRLYIDMASYDRARTAFELAIKLDPASALSWHYLGVAFYHLQRWDDAIAASLQAVELDPANADAFQNLGVTLAATRQFDRAAELLQEAARLDPRSFGAWYNLGNQLLMLNRFEAAADAFRRSVALQPDRAEAHLNLAIALLTAGRLKEGWREFEWRWRTKQIRSHLPPPTLPLWDGSRRPRTILLRAEQGLGDTLQFCRYAPLVSARGHDLVLEVQPELVSLLTHNFASPSVTVVARPADLSAASGLPRLDALAHLMSLPGIFRTTLDTIPNGAYLRAPADKVEAWRGRLDAIPAGIRVGLAWAGNPWNNSRGVDAVRSVPFSTVAPLCATSAVTFVSLQKGEAGKQLRDSCPPSCHDMTAELTDFSETAALIANLDLVICVDTSVAHLAGAMGKPVWLLSRFNGCWRWLADGADSPWYPTMRIFRQAADRSWPRVIDEVRQTLRAWVDDRRKLTSAAA